MPTNEEKRNVARRLRNNADQKPSWVIPWAVFNDAYEHEGAELINRLADLIEPEERTCHMKLSDCTDSLGQKMYRCSECGALMTDDACFFEGEPDIAWFSYCPSCGAKVVDDHA